MHAEGWTTNAVHAEPDYEGPVDFGDVPDNRLAIDPLGEQRLTARYEAHSGGERLATGKLVRVTVVHGDEADASGAIPGPDAFREAVETFQREGR